MDEVDNEEQDGCDHERDAGEWAVAFLGHLRETTNVTGSAECAGISRAMVYKRRDEDGDGFGVLWADTLEASLDDVEQAAHGFAKEEPSFTKWYLSRRRPAKWGADASESAAEGGRIKVVVNLFENGEQVDDDPPVPDPRERPSG